MLTTGAVGTRQYWQVRQQVQLVLPVLAQYDHSMAMSTGPILLQVWHDNAFPTLGLKSVGTVPNQKCSTGAVSRQYWHHTGRIQILAVANTGAVQYCVTSNWYNVNRY